MASAISSDAGPGLRRPHRTPVRRQAAAHAFALLLGALGAGLTAVHPAAARAEVYEEPAAFLTRAFPSGTPEPRVLWITPEIRAAMVRQTGGAIGGLRVRYWREGRKTAWILDEIGKEEPITAGIVVQDGRIGAISVLVYRESRGWEVRYPNFLRQFTGATLTDAGRLSAKVDGISGATLSVRAMRTMAARALLLHREALKAPAP